MLCKRLIRKRHLVLDNRHFYRNVFVPVIFQLKSINKRFQKKTNLMNICEIKVGIFRCNDAVK